MNRLSQTPTRLSLAALMLLAAAGPAAAQMREPDPAAAEAFKTMLDAYRARPGLEVGTSITVDVTRGEMASQGSEVEASFVFAQRPHCKFTLRDFTSYVGDGNLVSTHVSNDEAYFSMPDDDSPYYAILNAFVDIPFPHLALMLGEDKLEFVFMQFHPKAPNAVPTSVETITQDERTLTKIMMTSDFDEMEVLVDPETQLLESVKLTISGGDLVQAGSTTVYTHTYDYVMHDEPLDRSMFVFEPGDREKMDILAMIVKAPEVEPARGGPAANPNALVGKEAPEFILATMDGGAVDSADLRGQVVVLDFWATWCGPCRKGLPVLHDVAKWADEKQLPASFYTVNVWEIPPTDERNTPDNRLAAASRFWETSNYTLPVLMDYSDEVAGTYGVQGIPMTVIIRSDGIVHTVHTGLTDAATLEEDITEAIAAVEGEG